MMTATTNNSNRAKAIINIIAFVFVIIINYLAVTLPLNDKSTGELADLYPNKFTPAGFTFSIWSVIYTFLIGFIIYQAIALFKHKAIANKIAAISPWFVINCLANGGWLFAWHYQMVGLSVILMLVMLTTLIVIHEKLQLALPWQPLKQKLWLDVPFSLYLGWISIATIANVTTLLVDNDVNPLGLGATMWTIIMIAIGALLALIMIATKRNIVFALVVCWAFYGIIAKRKDVGDLGSLDIVLAAQVAIAIILIAIIIAVIKMIQRRQPAHEQLSS